MSRKMQAKVMGAGVLALVVTGIVAMAVALDRWDRYTQYDQTIYYGAAAVVFVLAQLVIRLVRK